MSSYNFTVTTVDYIFTATVSNPAELAFSNTQNAVTVTNSLSTVTVRYTREPVVVQLAGAGGSGNPFNQTLNTFDDVQFNSVTTHEIFGMSPVSFPTGISVANIGNAFIGDIDLAGIYNNFTNQLGLLYALTPIDFGGVSSPSPITVNFGTI